MSFICGVSHALETVPGCDFVGGKTGNVGLVVV